jgi:hypothetical protein
MFASSSTAASVGPGSDADLAATTFPVDLDRALAVANGTVPGGTVTKVEVSFDRPAEADAQRRPGPGDRTGAGIRGQVGLGVRRRSGDRLRENRSTSMSVFRQ